MSNQFQVGKAYRNRAGEYVVQAIDGDQMTIRYQDGRTLVTSVPIQARIWENIQFERQMARAEERKQQALEARKAARERAVQAKKEQAQPTFAGLQESDFEPRARGVAWSSRRRLGLVLANALNQRAGGSFDHWIVPRRPKIHVARKEFYDPTAAEANAVLFVAVNEKGVSYGYQVNKPAGKAQEEWPWFVLADALADSEKVCGTLHSVLQAHNLRLDIHAMEATYGRVARVTSQDEGFVWQHEDAGQEVSRQMSGQDLAGYLRELAPGKRCSLYVRKGLSPQPAVQAGADLAKEIAAVLEVLVPLYDASVSP
jgi:hypothetical protein